MLILMMFTMYLFLMKLYSKVYIIYLSLMVIIIWLTMNLFNFKKMNSFYLMNVIGLLILTFFNTQFWWKFYILYECSMFPMILLIMSWGYNPTRFSASLYMMIYMLLFSLPSLIIMVMNNCYFYSNLEISNFWMSNFMKMTIILMMMVKIPVFTLHYWLPKAHSEASTWGSIILASGLLKMGGLGYFKMSKFLMFSKMNCSLIMFLALISTIVCLMQNDFKKMIALMSVSHMTLSLSSLSTMSITGYYSFLMLNITHIITSGMLFYLSGLMFSMNKSRLLFINSLSIYKKTFMVWVMVLFMNLGTPPFFSFMSELWNLSIIFLKCYFNMSTIIILMIISMMYTLFLLNSFKNLKTKVFKMLSVKVFYISIFSIISVWKMI